MPVCVMNEAVCTAGMSGGCGGGEGGVARVCVCVEGGWIGLERLAHARCFALVRAEWRSGSVLGP